MKGSLIVLEGLDGSGKSTQFDALLHHFNNTIHGISFPNYSDPSSALIEMYLKGGFGEDVFAVNPYAVSAFYSADRFASYKKHWESVYNSGAVILASRYTTSNIIYQMAKLQKEEWESYTDWLYDFEYTKMGLPKPDLVLFLDMPVEVSQKLLTLRYNGKECKKDLHEKSINYLKACYEAAIFAAQKLGWKIISCAEGGNPRPVGEIKETLVNEITKIIQVKI